MATDGRLSPRPAAESLGGRHREGLCLPRCESLSLLQTVTILTGFILSQHPVKTFGGSRSRHVFTTLTLYCWISPFFRLVVHH